MLRELSRWVGAVLGAREDSPGDYEDRLDRRRPFGPPGVLLSAVLGRLRDAASRTGAQARRSLHALMLSPPIGRPACGDRGGPPSALLSAVLGRLHHAASRCGAEACRNVH